MEHAVKTENVVLLQRFASEDRLNAHCDSSHYVQHLLAVLPNGITDTLTLVRSFCVYESVNKLKKAETYSTEKLIFESRCLFTG